MNSYNLEEINLNNFIKGNYPAMPMMFSGCEKLEKIIMSNIDDDWRWIIKYDS